MTLIDSAVGPVPLLSDCPAFCSAEFRSVSKTYGMVSIALGVVFLFVGAPDVRGDFGVWAASSIVLGLFLVVFSTSFFC